MINGDEFIGKPLKIRKINFFVALRSWAIIKLWDFSYGFWILRKKSNYKRSKGFHIETKVWEIPKIKI